jgi:hypothetical protein
LINDPTTREGIRHQSEYDQAGAAGRADSETDRGEAGGRIEADRRIELRKSKNRHHWSDRNPDFSDSAAATRKEQGHPR